MKKILLGTLTVLALSPALIFARQGEGTEVEVHNSSDHAMVTSVATGSGSTKGTGMGAGKVNIQDIHRSSGTGATGSGWTSSGRTNTGALIEANLKALHADISKLTPEQKVELTAMIRTYLTSKGITPTVPTMNDDAKKAAKEEIKALREKQKAEIKAKREAQKAERKNYVGHVTLIKQ